MIETENQHWVPRFLIKNFCDSDGRVFKLDIESEAITKPPPKFAAAKPNFNELLVNGSPVSFEDPFERLETAAAPVVRKILGQKSLADLTTRDRANLSEFIAAQSFRIEAYRLGLSASGFRGAIGDVMNLMMADLRPLAGVILRRHWALLATPPEAPFYLGDNPVVLQSTEHPGEAGQLGFDVQGIEAFLPLSPTCALYMPCPSTGQEIIDGFGNALRISVADLAGIQLPSDGMPNALTIARRGLRTAQPLYDAFVRGVAIEAEIDNVINLNYLQCAWASTSIFSNRNDFSFALQVFHDNPGYRKVMPVSVVKTTVG